MSTLLCFYSEIHFVTKDYRYTQLLCKDTKSEWSGKIYSGITEAKYLLERRK